MKQIVTIPTIAMFAAALTAMAEIQTAKGGGQKLLESLKPATAPVAESVASTAPTAMLCPKCHNAKMTYATTSRGGKTELRTVEQHVCPGCATRIEAVGHGKAKTENVIHTCSFAVKGASCCQ